MENIHVPFLNSLGRAALGQPRVHAQDTSRSSPWEQRGDRTHPCCSHTPDTARGACGPCSQGQLPSLLRDRALALFLSLSGSQTSSTPFCSTARQSSGCGEGQGQSSEQGSQTPGETGPEQPESLTSFVKPTGEQRFLTSRSRV